MNRKDKGEISGFALPNISVPEKKSPKPDTRIHLGLFPLNIISQPPTHLALNNPSCHHGAG